MMRTKFPKGMVSTQTIGNIGLYYVCYRLSLHGWNVIPTARNAKGVDVLIFSQDAKRKVSIQVKTLSKRNPVPLGAQLECFIAEYVVVCVRNYPNDPICYVLTPKEVKEFAHKGEKNGKVSYWLQPAAYEKEEYRDKWERIGHGVP
jgi:hypothetical protein